MTAGQGTSPLLSQAVSYLQEGDAESADLLLETYLARKPEDTQALFIAALCRHALGDNDAAIAHLKKSLTLAPQEVRAAMQLASIYADLGQAHEALTTLDDAVAVVPNDIELVLAKAALHRRFGDAVAAEATAELALRISPNMARAHYALGLAKAQRRHPSGARLAFQKAVELDPAFADAWVNLGVVEKGVGDLTSAANSFQQALKLKPDDPVAHNNFGNLLLEQRTFDAALKSYHRAVALDPHYLDAKVNLALALRESGDVDGCIVALKKVLQEHPNQASVLNAYGNALRQAERFKEAQHALESALELEPENAEVLNNLGLVLALLGERFTAADMFERACALRPDMPVLANNYGTLLLKMFDLEAAIYQLARAVSLDSTYLDALVNLGVAHFMRGNYDEAIRAYRQTLSIDSYNAFAHYSLGVALLEQQDLTEAVKEIEYALIVNPHNVMARNTLGVALLEQHRIKEARTAMATAAEADTMSAPVYASNHLFTSLYQPDVDNDELYRIHCDFGRRFTSGEIDQTRPHANPRDLNRKLRLAYMSPDFRGHSVSHFMEALLEKHDRSAFEVILYSNTTRIDKITQAMERAANVWVETAGLTDAALVERIRSDRVDVLVNLGGHTSGNRLPACGHKPAPVQIEYLGYPDTSGVTAMDYRITDERADPKGEAESRSIETLLRLPECFHCYRPTSKAPSTAPAPHLERGYVTFGSFNVLPKLNANVVEAWSEILKHVPKSRLYLKCKQLKTESVRDRVLGYFSDAGIEASRISMEAFVPSVKDHLGRYAGVDLALDTFPYNGTTTTCEALWMGVPVLTVLGDRHSGRVGLSLLSAAGLDEEFVAPDIETYVAKAIAWGKSPERLAEIRGTLRGQMKTSPLRNEVEFTRTLEALYRTAWQAWCEGPETFEHKAPRPLRTDDSVQSVLAKVV
ncbi:MAG: tetratricopeptide repeat protein [Rhodospirillaceae bacterium]